MVGLGHLDSVCSASMSAAQLPYLPPEVMDCVARAALHAEGGTAEAWVRLSLVCHTWRDSLRGARDTTFSGSHEHSSDK